MKRSLKEFQRSLLRSGICCKIYYNIKKSRNWCLWAYKKGDENDIKKTQKKGKKTLFDAQRSLKKKQTKLKEFQRNSPKDGTCCKSWWSISRCRLYPKNVHYLFKTIQNSIQCSISTFKIYGFVYQTILMDCFYTISSLWLLFLYLILFPYLNKIYG